MEQMEANAGTLWHIKGSDGGFGEDKHQKLLLVNP
jgi:hypothetical protein